MAVVGTLVPTEASLEDCLADLKAASRIGVDTEFHAERRYRPQLLLIQLATSAERVWLLDPTIEGFDPAPALHSLSHAELIVHGGIQDLRLLADHGLSPGRVLDTQRAAGLLGLHYPERLSVLCHHLLDEKLDKSSTLTRWDIRPLSVEQRRYATEDAQQLLFLAERLEERLRERDRLSWAWALGEELRQEALDLEDVPNLLEEWEICTRLDDQTLRCLLALQRWRFEHAMQRNKPPHYVMSNGIMLDLARRQPDSIRALKQNRRLHPSLIKHHRKLLRCTQGPNPPLPRPAPTADERRLVRLLELWAELVGEAHDVAPKLLLPHPFEVVREGVGALTGWRAPFQKGLENFLSGHESIKADFDSTKINLSSKQ